ncbi:MAG: 6-bladed beta-propeller [Desulfobulbaceae bacterium]|nr:6-bladed beta-propeller [Desulfobulbaceae bacterium]
MKIYKDMSSIWLLRLLFLAAVLLSISFSSQASELPDYERLDPVTNSITSPVAVALDRDGRLYVAETRANRVVILSQSGRFIGKLDGLSEPISVAVDSGGPIYVGSKEKGNVAVYDADFTFLFKLGSGDDEFIQPDDICIDPTTGWIYVVDRGSDLVRIYDSTGQSVGSIGSSGNGDGQFHHPVSIAIDEGAEEIIVLDRQLAISQKDSTTLLEGARIQFFAMDGTYKRGFSRFDSFEGDMIRPQKIAVDNESRIYVTDSLQNVVLVYDNLGNSLRTVHDLENPMRVPHGITINGANRLYIASRMANRIEVYGIDEYTRLDVNPVELEFTAREGDADPEHRSIGISNSGKTAFNWSAVENTDWLSLSEVGGVLGLGQTEEIDVAVDTTGLAPGKYSGSIAVSAGPGAVETVMVALKVEPAAILSAAPTLLAFASETGTAPGSLSFTVANSGSASLYWNVFADQPWIDLSRTQTSGILADSAAAPVPVTVNIDPAGLAAGTYNGTITVTGHDALGSPATIGVTLMLTEPAEPPEDEYPPTPPPGSTWKGNFGRTWTVVSQFEGISLNGIWGSSNSDIFAVGDSGLIFHFDGANWNDESTDPVNLNGIRGTSAADVLAVGDNGLILHYDGENWTGSTPFADTLYSVWCANAANCYAVGDNTTILAGSGKGSWIPDCPDYIEDIGTLYGIWGTSESDVYAVGDGGAILHNNGSGWEPIDSGVTTTLFGIWGSSADNIFAVGQNGTILHYKGTDWIPMNSGTTVTLKGIWGNAANEVYAVGADGTMLLYQGATWQRLETGLAEALNGAWGGRLKEIYAVGADGSIIFGKYSFPWCLMKPIIHQNQKEKKQ